MDEVTDFVVAMLSMHNYEEFVVGQGWPIEKFLSRLSAVLRNALVAQPDRRQV